MNSLETAYIAGGCFWCTEAVFQRLNGVEEIHSGYMGGNMKNPAYREVCSGTNFTIGRVFHVATHIAGMNFFNSI